MIAPAPPFPDDRQGQSLKAFQQTLNRGVAGRVLQVAGIQPCQHRPFGGQAPVNHERHQCEDP